MSAKPAHSAADRAAPFLLATLFVLALFIHRPWEFAPFSRIDFSEFLPLLTDNHDFGSRFAAFVRRYAEEGRFNVLQYASLALKWTWLGDAPVLWQLLRTAQMAALVAGVYVLLRRLAISPFGAAVGASLFILGGAATSAMTRLTMGEPLGTLFLVGAAIIAADYWRRERWLGAALGICGLVVAALLTKEMLVGAVPFLLILACCRHGEQQWGLPNLRERRNWALLALLSIAVLAVMIPVAWIVLHAREGSFSSGYGSGGPVFQRFGDSLAVLFFPWAPGQAMDGAGTLGLLPNVVFLGCIAVLTVLSRQQHTQRRAILALGLLLPVTFAVLYTPWEYVLAFYALPTTLSGAILVGNATDHIRAYTRPLIPVGAAAVVASVVVASKLVFAYADLARAERHLDRALVSHISAESTATEILVSAVRPKEGPLAWTARGPTIVRYASVLTGRSMPPAKEVDCRTVDQLHRSPPGEPVLLVVFPQDCGPLPAPTTRVIHRFRTLRFWPPAVAKDSFGVDLVMLSRASARAEKR